MTLKKAADNAFLRESLYGTLMEPTNAGALSFMRRKYTRDLTGVDLVVTGDSNTVTINENSTATMLLTDKKVTNITAIGGSNTITSTHTGAADQDTTLHHTGSSSTFLITQGGANDGTTSITTVGSGHDVTVTMDD